MVKHNFYYKNGRVLLRPLEWDDIEIRMYDIPWHISISRIVVMLVVYWGTLGLIGLQRNPDYVFGNSKRENETDEA